MTIQRLTLEEESNLILDDIFDKGDDAQVLCLKELAALHNLDYSTMTQEEVQDMIIEYEDDLYALHDNYRYSKSV